ncbi:MAG TPA: flap endonuclease-1 [Methanothermococcus okinawensis]|uniref:Flap endonuclease 1 n=1 Tax=Methanothermococcus okinawensis TaxID=155863 RepID=A0A832YTP6_9EURY|nr:flap endonuclease-1 [Methanothermococcus okinawensis]
MGVQFNDLIPKREILLKDLKNKTLTIDSMNILYQFMSSIRLNDGSPLRNSKGEITSIYNGLFYKNIYILEYGITPVWVFDGKPPELKYETREERKKIKEREAQKYKKAKNEGNLEDMYKYAKRVNYLEVKIVENSKKLLRLMGIPYINAPSEGEAQCSYLVKKGDAYGVVSQDYDALLYGSTRIIRNITSSNKPLELIELEEVLNHLEITLDDLIDVAILIGTDYNMGGIKGIGPKKALNIVKNNIKEEYIKNIPNYHKIKNIFKNPEVTDNYKLNMEYPDVDGLKKFLIDEMDFSEKRVIPYVKKLEKLIHERKNQSTLEAWF